MYHAWTPCPNKRCIECGKFVAEGTTCQECVRLLDEVEDDVMADWEWLRQHPRD